MRLKELPAAGLSLALLIVVADQLLKSWAHAWVGAHGPIRAFPGLNIIATSNTGIAFGIGQGAALWILVGIALAISVWLFLWLLRTQKTVEAIGLGLVIGGALSNVLDRLRLGSVRDFIDVYWRDWHWPAFNLADAAIFTGLALIVLVDVGSSRKHKRSGPESDPDQSRTRS